MLKSFKAVKIISLVLVFGLLMSICVYADNSSDSEQISDKWVTYNFNTPALPKGIIKPILEDKITNIDVNGKSGPSRVIIGSDGRKIVTDTSKMPYSAICNLDIIAPDGNGYVGTGWLFADDCLVTAAHCIYNTSFGGMADSVIVRPGSSSEDNQEPFGSCRAVSARFNEAWISNQLDDADFVLLKLDKPIGQVCGYFDYQCQGGKIGDNITVTGYGDLSSDYIMTTMSGRLNAVTATRLSYTIDTERGQSGAPVYLTDSNIVIGTHVRGYLLSNDALRLTKNMCDAMEQLKNE